MARPESHMLGSKHRIYSGEPWAPGLIAWIEKHRDRPTGMRIQALLREMGQIVECMQKPEFGYSQSGVPVSVRMAKSPELSALREKLGRSVNRRLRRYRLWPELLLLGSTESPDRWVPRWHAEGERSRTPNSETEADAVLRVLLLAQNGNIHRVRECVDCGGWFYARFSHARFCSNKCQQRNYRQSPEWRKHRNEYMRDYYSRQYAKKGKRDGK